MDLEKFTERARGFVQAAQTIALREQNQQLETQHLLKALLDDREGLAAGLIRAAGATPAGVVIALDRMERGKGTLSAVQEVKENFGIPVIAVATLEDLIGYLADSPELAANLDAVKAYREQYGISAR